MATRFTVHARRLVLLGAASAVFASAPACDSDGPFDECTELSEADLSALPASLSETGINDERVFRFTPQFPLWSDGVKKLRFGFIPEGAQVDASDIDDWRFPVGTKFWKEFSQDGRKLETRILEKVGPEDGDWLAAAYLWNEDGTEATLSVEGLEDAYGSEHDVPAATVCVSCHGGRRSQVLGFSAIQLSPQPDSPTPEGDLDLAAAVEAGLIDREIPTLRVPGDETARRALGYAHANCGHCHNEERPESEGPRCYKPERGFDLWLRAAELEDIEDTAFVRTAVREHGADARDEPPFVRGDAESGQSFRLMESRGPAERWGPTQMPPLATEKVDESGVAALKAFVASL